MLWILALGYQGGGRGRSLSACSVSESIPNGKSDKNPFFQIILNISSNNDRYHLLMMCSSNVKATKNKLKDLICSIS